MSEKERRDRVEELHTIADKLPPLSRKEADVAGITTTPEAVYADTDMDPNRDDQRDEHHG